MVVFLMFGRAAADEQRWFFVDYSRDVRLIYGVPDSEVATVWLICRRNGEYLSLGSTVVPTGVEIGRAARIRLSNGITSIAYEGRIVRDDEGTLQIDVSTPPSQRLFNLMRIGTWLAIDVGGARKSVPLSGMPGPLAQMERACPAR